MKKETKELIKQSLQYARTKHPLFADNESAGVSIIGEEFGFDFDPCPCPRSRDFYTEREERFKLK